MPTYVYRREDGTTFEIEQRITADPLEACPTTGQAVSRVITGGTGLIFKGSGFYLTDYARNNGNGTTPDKKTDAKNGTGSKENTSKEAASATASSSES